jgi:drug/metabolite transporter (DMT)-like permease
VQSTTKAWLQIHLAVLLWGFTSILGREITLSAPALNWWRMVLVVVPLGFAPGVRRGIRAMERRRVAGSSGTGVLLAMHWVTFYGAIKLANASVAATCIALAPAFVSIVDPLIGPRRFNPRELLLGFAIAPGVALVVGGVPGEMRLGFLVGTSSALILSFYSALTKKLIGRGDSLAVACIQFAAGLLFLTALMPLWAREGALIPIPSSRDAVLLLVLAVGCTLLPMGAYLAALRHLPVFGIQLTVTLEPVYSVVLAMLLLGEQRELSPLFYLGVAIIVGGVIAQPAIVRATF